MYVVYLFTNPAILNYYYFAFGSYSLWKFLEFSESKKAYYQIWAWRKPRISHAEFRVIWNWCVWKFLVENSTWKNDISVFRQKMTRKDPTWEKRPFSDKWPFSDERPFRTDGRFRTKLRQAWTKMTKFRRNCEKSFFGDRLIDLEWNLSILELIHMLLLI